MVSVEVRLVLISTVGGHRQETNCHDQVFCKAIGVPKTLKEALDWNGCKGDNVIDEEVDGEKRRKASIVVLQLGVEDGKDEDDKVNGKEEMVDNHAIHVGVDLLSEESKEGVFFAFFGSFAKFVTLSPFNSF